MTRHSIIQEFLEQVGAQFAGLEMEFVEALGFLRWYVDIDSRSTKVAEDGTAMRMRSSPAAEQK